MSLVICNWIGIGCQCILECSIEKISSKCCYFTQYISKDTTLDIFGDIYTWKGCQCILGCSIVNSRASVAFYVILYLQIKTLDIIGDIYAWKGCQYILECSIVKILSKCCYSNRILKYYRIDSAYVYDIWTLSPFEIESQMLADILAISAF